MMDAICFHITNNYIIMKTFFFTFVGNEGAALMKVASLAVFWIRRIMSGLLTRISLRVMSRSSVL